MKLLETKSVSFEDALKLHVGLEEYKSGSETIYLFPEEKKISRRLDSLSNFKDKIRELFFEEQKAHKLASENPEINSDKIIELESKILKLTEKIKRLNRIENKLISQFPPNGFYEKKFNTKKIQRLAEKLVDHPQKNEIQNEPEKDNSEAADAYRKVLQIIERKPTGQIVNIISQ